MPLKNMNRNTSNAKAVTRLCGPAIIKKVMTTPISVHTKSSGVASEASTILAIRAAGRK
jgi:hypothetical protein